MRPEIKIDIIRRQKPVGFEVRIEHGVKATDLVTGKFAESFDQLGFHLNRAKAIELLDECLKNNETGENND